MPLRHGNIETLIGIEVANTQRTEILGFIYIELNDWEHIRFIDYIHCDIFPDIINNIKLSNPEQTEIHIIDDLELKLKHYAVKLENLTF